MRKACLFLLGCLLCSFSVNAEELRGFVGKSGAVSASTLTPAMRDGDGYGEKYTFNAEFGEVGDLYFSMTISNFGLGDHKMEARGRFTIDGKKVEWKRELDDDEWSRGRSGFRLKAGTAILEGTPDRLVITSTKSGSAIEAVFTPIARAWRPGSDGRALFGKHISDFTIFPLMNVEAKVTMKGQEPKTITGIGYGTHTWSDLMTYDMATVTYDFRGIDGDATVYFRKFVTTKEYGAKPLSYLLITKGDKVIAESFSFDMQPTADRLYIDKKHDNKYKVPESFTLTAPGVKGTFTKKKLRQRKDILADMNFAVRQIAKAYSKPVRYDYDTNFSVDAGGQHFEGVGRYEVYHWNKAE